jgi:hypothetical protein
MSLSTEDLLHAGVVALAILALSAPPALSAASARQDAAGEALRAAASGGDIEAVRAQLAEGVDVDAANDYGATALILAALNGHGEVVRALLDAGADAELADTFYGRSPMAWASIGGSEDVVSMLFIAGAGDFDALLMEAVTAGDIDQVAQLLQMQVPADEVLSEALQHAIAARSEPLAQLLMSAGAVPPPPTIISIDVERLRLYEGRYADEVGFELMIIADERTIALLVRPPGLRNPLRFVPVEESTFISENNESIVIRFTVRDDRVVSMSFTQAGATRRMSKQ